MAGPVLEDRRSGIVGAAMGEVIKGAAHRVGISSEDLREDEFRGEARELSWSVREDGVPMKQEP